MYHEGCDGRLVGFIWNKLWLFRFVKMIEAALVAMGVGQRHLEQKMGACFNGVTHGGTTALEASSE